MHHATLDGAWVYVNITLVSLPIAGAPLALLFPTTASKLLFGALLLSYVIVVFDIITRQAGKGVPLWTDVLLLVCTVFLALYFWVNYVWEETNQTKPECRVRDASLPNVRTTTVAPLETQQRKESTH